MNKLMGVVGTVSGLILLCSATAFALDISDKLSIEGHLAGAYQYQSLSSAPGYDDTGRGGLTFQPALYFQLTEKDVIYAKFGFGAGNSLNDGTAPFALSTWATDLEADVRGISGGDRDYLLTAWYGHLFDLGTAGRLDLTGGIVDATDYLDDNAYANDGLTQFMNSALVNGPNVFLPSYDLGGVAQWEKDAWSARLVMMSVADNEAGNSYNYYGAQAGYTLKLGIGEGTYRLNMNRTTDDFDGTGGAANKSKTGLLTSCDQQLGDTFGAWVRIGWQDDDALINYKYLYSGGIHINGRRWARELDNIGIGYAFMEGGNSHIDQSEVVEIYYRCVLNDVAALTLDFQYLEEKFIDGREADNPKGLISSLRFVAVF